MISTSFLPTDLNKPLHIEFEEETETENLAPSGFTEDSSAELIFDFFSPMNSARAAYAHFYRDVLSLQSVADAEKSVGKINDLFEYFHKLNDFAGKHHAMILALTGRNQAKWKGLGDVAEVYEEWLKRH